MIYLLGNGKLTTYGEWLQCCQNEVIYHDSSNEPTKEIKIKNKKTQNTSINIQEQFSGSSVSNSSTADEFFSFC